MQPDARAGGADELKARRSATHTIVAPLPPELSAFAQQAGNPLTVVVVGTSFNGELVNPQAHVARAAPHAPPTVRADPGATLASLAGGAHASVPFRLVVPNVDRAELVDALVARAGSASSSRSRTRTSSALTFVTGRRQRLLAGDRDRLDERADPRRPDRPRRLERTHVRPVHDAAATSTWSSLHAGRGDLLGRQHAARRALERDDARDRQGPPAARRSQGFGRWPRSRCSAPATSAWSPGACFADLGHDVVIRDVVPERIERLRAGEVPIYEPGLDQVLERNRERLRFTLDVERGGRRRRVPLRRRRHAADVLRRRRPRRRLGRRRRAAGRRRRPPGRRHEEHRPRRHGRARARAARRARPDERRLRLQPGVPRRGQRRRRLHDPGPHRRRRVRPDRRRARRRAAPRHRRPRSCAPTSPRRSW